MPWELPGDGILLGDDRRAGALQVVVDPLPHRPAHRVAGQLCGRDPADLAGLRARGRLAADGPGGQHDTELAADLVVTGEVDDMTRVGVDPEQAGHLNLYAGLLEGFPDGRVGYGLGHLDRAAGQCPVAVVGAADQQHRAVFTGHDRNCRGDDAVRLRCVRVVVVVDPS